MRSLVVAGLVTMAAGVSLVAQGWPQWRGPSQDAVVPAAQVPAAWPAAYARGWRVDAGEGYASPVLAGTRVFVHGRRDPNEIVTAIDVASGKVLWQQTYASDFTKNSYASRMAKGPNATPLVAGARVFTLGASGVLKAWDAASGRTLWTKDYSARVDTSKLFCGTSASPILVDGSLIVQVGSDVKGGLITALDPATGASRWEWTGDGPGYATPIVFQAAAVRQVATLTNRSVIGLEAATGKLLWTIPFADEWHENIVTPTWTGSSLIVSGVRQGTHAYRLAIESGQWKATQLWKNPDVAMYMSSPVVADGLIYGLSSKRKGQFVAVDAATGATKWATEGREAEHASALLTPRHVLFLTNAGALVVAKRATAAFEVERKYELAGAAETWAVPIILGPDLILREGATISRLKGQ
jgi:outer membrane protein assembly factor BamB